MDITGSTRKRASAVVPEEIVEPVDYGEGLKNVPEAELEHVIPIRRAQEEVEQSTQKNTEQLKKRVFESLQSIDRYEREITDIVAHIDDERKSLKEMIDRLSD